MKASTRSGVPNAIMRAVIQTFSTAKPKTIEEVVTEGDGEAEKVKKFTESLDSHTDLDVNYIIIQCSC